VSSRLTCWHPAQGQVVGRRTGLVLPAAFSKLVEELAEEITHCRAWSTSTTRAAWHLIVDGARLRRFGDDPALAGLEVHAAHHHLVERFRTGP
jgi:hypothetical protein